jgi:DNA-binding response OmpR family regulator
MPAYDAILIDDEAALGEIFQHYVLFKFKEWRFLTFSNSDVAYEQIMQNNLDATVWIVDLMMPGKNGVQIAEAIRAKHGTTPVVLAYTAIDPQDVEKHIEYQDGVDHFTRLINKRFDIPNLLELVNNWIASTNASNDLRIS